MVVPSGYKRSLLAATAIVMLIATVGSSIMQSVWAKNLPMGHPSLILQLRAGDDPRFDFFVVDEESVELLNGEIANKVYGIIETIVLLEIEKQFNEKKEVYLNGYVEYISASYKVDDSRLEILIAKQPEEYGCNTEGCAVRVVEVDVPDELKLSQVREVSMFIAVYETPDNQLVDRILTKALSEARILLSEASAVLEEKKEELLADKTPIERFFLRQYEDISRVTIFFSPFEPGSAAKEPIDIVDTSNTYYKRANSGSFENESSVISGEEWNSAHVVGKFLNSDPPKPDQTFQVHYRVINGTMDSFNIQREINDVVMSNMIVAKVNGIDGSNGTLEIEFPRNFPYSNSGGGIEMFDIHVNGTHENTERDNRITADCFFVFSIPFRGSDVEIEMGVPSILIKAPYHGDNVPDSCISQTTVETTIDQLKMCSELGIPSESCNEEEIDRELAKQRAHEIALSDEERKRIEEQQNQINNSMYMIGIGAAIAGVFAFITLRKK